MNVKLVSVTEMTENMAQDLPSELHNPEGLMAYAARVSSENQTNPDYEKLLKYCITHKHWSVFETVDMTVEITTSRAIAQQILRHKSFTFQEFSQRYSTVTSFETYEARRQDLKNRQNSIDDLPVDVQQWFKEAQADVQVCAENRYQQALKLNIAKELARFLLPSSTTTKLYMKGSVRSWVHYIEVRTDPSTQKEHRDVALQIKEQFKTLFPITSKALGWL
jgi:thymidylate synthase (FAD)